MRTTIDLPDHLRARLLARAAEHGEKGYSRLIQEALEQYLSGGEPDTTARRRRALAAIGSVGAADVVRMRESIRKLRSSWR